MKKTQIPQEWADVRAKRVEASAVTSENQNEPKSRVIGCPQYLECNEIRV